MKDTDFLDVVNILSGDNIPLQGVLMQFQGIGMVLAGWTLSTANKHISLMSRISLALWDL